MTLNSNGFDVRFSYNSTKLKPSSIETNEITDDSSAYFQYEDEFKDCLDWFTLPFDKDEYTDVSLSEDEEVILATVTFKPPIEESDYVVDKGENIGKVFNTTGGVLLGRMSFQMAASEDVFDPTWFRIVGISEDLLETLENPEDYTYPITGIKVNVDNQISYQAHSTFIFTDKTASKEARISDLILSTGEVDEENPENSTYKEYKLNPIFNQDTEEYELTLMEYIDYMNIKVTPIDSNATIKISVPERDEDNKLVYESDGTEIKYIEKDVTHGVPLEFTLNKLGEPDTKVTLTVTAEDGKTEKNYTILIKRPYGTIEGQLLTYNKNDIHIGTVKIYKAEEVTWEDYYVAHNDVYTYTDLPLPLDFIESEDDGTFSIKVIPGKYDIMIDKMCYMDHIMTNIEIAENETKDFEIIELLPGDLNKDGMIDAKDFNNIKLYFGQESLEADVDESGTVDAPDFNAVKLRFGQAIEIY